MHSRVVLSEIGKAQAHQNSIESEHPRTDATDLSSPEGVTSASREVSPLTGPRSTGLRSKSALAAAARRHRPGATRR
jgi:hypothetical protein